MANQSLERTKEKFSTYMEKVDVKKLIRSTVGANFERFTTSVCSAVSNNPDLQRCDYKTILTAAMLGESLKLSPSPQLGHFYMVPFEDRRNQRTVATFVLGYKGYIQLAMRSGRYADLDVIEVKEGEYLGRSKTNGKHLFSFIEDEWERENLPTIGYLAYLELLNGFRKEIFWSKQKMIHHADRYSAAFNAKKYDDFINGRIPENERWKYSSYWYKDFDGMAFKTLIRQLISKWGVMSIDMDMQSAVLKDDAVINENGEPEFFDKVDDVPDIPQSMVMQPNPIVTDEEAAQFDFFAGAGGSPQ